MEKTTDVPLILYRGCSDEEADNYDGTPFTGTYWTACRAEAEEYATDYNRGGRVIACNTAGDTFADWDDPAVQQVDSALASAEDRPADRAAVMAFENADSESSIDLPDVHWLRIGAEFVSL